MKNFNVLIDGKKIFWHVNKNDEDTYKQIIEMGRNNDYMAGNLLDYKYFSKHCRLIAIDLSKNIELEIPELKQKINFSGILERASNNVFHHLQVRRHNI